MRPARSPATLIPFLGGALLALAACNPKNYNYQSPEDTGEGGDDGELPDGVDENDADSDGFTDTQGDCDDDEPGVNPDATEMCDGIDNDCDGVIDEEDAADVSTWYFDGDADGFGDPDRSAIGCDGYDNHVADNTDCDDDRSGVHPGAEEACDGLDNDCDDEIDEDLPDSAPTFYRDSDNDGYGTPDDSLQACSAPEGYEDNDDDCDDMDADINPSASDGIINEIDDDCDGIVDGDASCNPYQPFGNGPGATRVYSTLSYDGSTYTETVNIQSWDSGTGQAVLQRSFSNGITTLGVQETHRCNGAAIQMTGWVYNDGAGGVYTFTYSSGRTDLEDPSLLSPGQAWSYAYTAADGVTGLGWEASGRMEVYGTEEVSVAAGNFTALRVDNTYSFIDSSGVAGGNRDGTIQTWWVEGLGQIKVIDTGTDGTVHESRELQSYTGFYP